MNDYQRMFDAMAESARQTRADYHLTLANLIAAMSDIPPTLVVRFDWNHQYPDNAMSYRGYYSDLSFDWKPTKTTVEEFLNLCKSALGEVYVGYKGGDFVMDGATPLWASEYGTTGRAITGITQDAGGVILLTKDIP